MSLPPRPTAGPGNVPFQLHGWYGNEPTFSSHELRSSIHSSEEGSLYAVTGGRGTGVGLVYSAGVMLKPTRDWGTQWEGEGARRRRFAGGLDADWVGESGGEVVPGSASRARLWVERAGAVDGRDGVAVAMRSGASVGPEGEILGEEEDEVVIWGRFAALTGLRMHRFTWRLRLDATPKRRPQVSHTNAAKTDQEGAWAGGVDGPFSPVWTSKCWTSVSVRVYKTGNTDLSESGGSVKGLFAHAAAVLLLAGTRASAFLLGCAGRGGAGAGGADGLGDVRARRGAGVGGGGGIGGGGVGRRGGHVGEAYGEGVRVVVLEWLREEKGQRVGPVAVGMPAGDRPVAGQRRGHVERAERRRRRVAVVDGRSVEEARIRIRRSVRRSGVRECVLLRECGLRRKRGQLCTAWSLHDKLNGGGRWDGPFLSACGYIYGRRWARRQEAIWTTLNAF